ncbi:hypothetical protein 10P302A_gene0010 [Pseudomonas phage 10P302A]|uniref:Uncharacterized protein n=1 Tax=Pseudomonas phage 10P302A TaxID=3038233 RepID=A0AAF0K2D6_9CAUD|nr:hypothetical protein 10P302A_gene0010 [Pseudomonas phage 10P302A]
MKIHDQKDCPVKHVRFLAFVPGVGQPQLVEFTLGDGPCGRHVDCLEVYLDKSFIQIVQGSTGVEQDDYEIKHFLYKMSDVQGRIVVTR